MVPMNNYYITLTEHAKRDLMEIADYIAYTLLEPDTSVKFIKHLRHSISELSTFPYKFPLVQNVSLPNHNIRCMPYKNYYVFYEIIEAMHTVIILRIGYNKRNWKNILLSI